MSPARLVGKVPGEDPDCDDARGKPKHEKRNLGRRDGRRDDAGAGGARPRRRPAGLEFGRLLARCARWPWERIQFLQDRINRGISDGSLNRGEGMRAQQQLNNIKRQAWQMRRRGGGQLNARDNAWLQRELDNLSRRLRWLRHNGW